MTRIFKIALLTSVLTAVLCVSCQGDRHSSNNNVPSVESSHRSSDLIMHDFGRVDVRNRTAHLDHKFRLFNSSEFSLEIVSVKPTCGCVESKLERDIIEPGESIMLELAMSMSNGGQTTHGATILFSDDSIVQCMMSAFGTVGIEFTPILSSTFIDNNLRKNIRFYLVDSDGIGSKAVPTIVYPDGIELDFEEWITIEKQSPRKLRPTRQIANATLLLDNYSGIFPVEIRILLEHSIECSVTLERTPDNI